MLPAFELRKISRISATPDWTYSTYVPASNLATVGDLSTLGTTYPGWSTSGSSFTCATIDGGTGCQLTLTYTPTTPTDTGTVQIPFNYTNNAGIGCNGTLNINYQSTP